MNQTNSNLTAAPDFLVTLVDGYEVAQDLSGPDGLAYVTRDFDAVKAHCLNRQLHDLGYERMERRAFRTKRGWHRNYQHQNGTWIQVEHRRLMGQTFVTYFKKP